MKNLLAPIILVLAINIQAQTDTLKLSSDIWPPFTDIKGEKSIAFDIVERALERIGIYSDYKIMEFDEVLAGLETGEYDGSAALWKTKEREEQLIYSNSYLENQLILLGRKGSNPSITSISELDGKRIGLIEGYAYGDSLRLRNSAQIIYSKSDQENLEKLISEQIDFMLVDELLIQYLLKYQLNDVSALLEFSTVPVLTKPLHLAIRKEITDAEKIINLFNQEIAKMISDGTYNQLLELNWIRADIDGDGKMELILTGDAAGIEPPTNSYDVYHTDSSANNSGYYVNGKLYSEWNEIPDNYRVPNTPVTSPDDPDTFGMKLNF